MRFPDVPTLRGFQAPSRIEADVWDLEVVQGEVIERLATRIIELDRGRLRSFPGSYAAYQRRKAELHGKNHRERHQHPDIHPPPPRRQRLLLNL